MCSLGATLECACQSLLEDRGFVVVVVVGRGVVGSGAENEAEERENEIRRRMRPCIWRMRRMPIMRRRKI